MSRLSLYLITFSKGSRYLLWEDPSQPVKVGAEVGLCLLKAGSKRWQSKVLAAQPGNLNLLPGACVMEEEPILKRKLPSEFHMHAWHTVTLPHNNKT